MSGRRAKVPTQERIPLGESMGDAPANQLSTALASVSHILAAVEPLRARQIRGAIEGFEDHGRAAGQIRLADETVREHGLTMDDIHFFGLRDAIDFSQYMEIGKANARIQDYATLLCLRAALEQEAGRAYRPYDDDLFCHAGTTAFDLPHTTSHVAGLGLGRDLAKRIVNSWCSYDARAEDGRTSPTASPHEAVARLVRIQSERLWKQVESITWFAQQFGQEDLKAVVTTFGIHNFARYSGTLLHAQLEAWNSGTEPVRTVWLSAQADPNLAITGDCLISTDATVFEVGNAADMGRALVAVGKRDRKHNRNPLDGYVETVVVNAHGHPDSLQLSRRIAGLTTTAYEHAERVNARDSLRPQTFENHIGNRWQAALAACSAAGDNRGKPNIAEAMTASGAPVHGCADPVAGMHLRGREAPQFYTVDKSSFTERRLPTITYLPSTRHQAPSRQNPRSASGR